MSARTANLLTFLGAAVVALVAGALILAHGLSGLLPDAFDYWAAWHGPMYVQGATIWLPNYQYSPAFAQLVWPLAQLPWPAFAAVWTVAAFGAYAWLLWPVHLPTRIALLIAIAAIPLSIGNIEWLLALVAVAMLRWPGTLALPLLTKVTPGVAGLWFIGRREWHQATVAAAATAALILASFVLAPDLWIEWVRLLVHNAGAPGSGLMMGFVPVPPLIVRAPVAGVLALWGGWRGKTWTIPAAMVLAQPDLTLATLAVLTALPRLSNAARREISQA
jgi:Glycosyltransferase family 87